MSNTIDSPTGLKREARLLVVRFSSFGDIVQAMAVPMAFCSRFPGARVDWLVRADFKGLLEAHPKIESVHAFSRSAGFSGLLRLAWRLGGENYTHLYDAHANVRSRIVVSVFRLRRLFSLFGLGWPKILRRPKNRLRRFLFFHFRWRSALPMPFRGVRSFLEPLAPWGIASQPPAPPQFFVSEAAHEEAARTLSGFQPDVALIPSAAWEMKRWPVEYWKQLIALLPDLRFAVLGGPEDAFCAELEQLAPARVKNLAGRMSLAASAAVLRHAVVTIANDTGLLHVADQMGLPVIALIGPTAFGYPSQAGSEWMETSLWCKPCSKDGRGKCVNPVYQKCLIDVTPEAVALRVRARLRKSESTDARGRI